MPDTGTEIEGRLHKVSGSKATAEASTKNVTQNKYKVYVQVYAKDGSNVVNSSVSTKSANSFVSTRSTSTTENRWESLHSTTPSNDPYKSLRIYK